MIAADRAKLTGRLVELVNAGPGERGSSVYLPDRDVMITVKVTPRLSGAENHRKLAEEKVKAEPWRASSCAAETTRRVFGKHRGSCTRRPVGALVIASYTGNPIYIFVCGTHRKHHGFKPDSVLGWVDLPRGLFDDAKREVERQRATDRANEHAAEDARRAAQPLQALARRGEP